MKRLIALTMCVVSLGAAAQLPDYVPTDGLVAWIPLDDANTFYDEQGGMDIQETYEALPAPDRFGVPNGAHSFDGNDDFIALDSETQAFDFSGQQAISISVWVKPNSSGPQFGLLGYSPFLNAYPQYALKIESSGSMYFISGASLFEDNGFNTGTTTLNMNQWSHLVMTYDGIELKFFLNGLLEFQNVISDTFPSALSGSRLFLGKAWGANNTSLDGSLDDAGVWSRALHLEEVQQLHLAGLGQYGCTDEIACNYNSEANIDDESCLYTPHETLRSLVELSSSSELQVSVPQGLSSWSWSDGVQDSTRTIQPLQEYVLNGFVGQIPELGEELEGGVVFAIDTMAQTSFLATNEPVGSGAEWGCKTTTTGATSTAFGAGQTNTQIILDACQDSDCAARIANSVGPDWYLPSRDELEAIRVRLHNAGLASYSMNNTYNWYWSSTECLTDGTAATDIHFSDGFVGECNNKDSNPGGVIAVKNSPMNFCLYTDTLRIELDGDPLCGIGTVWDEISQTCIVANPSDSNFDGCVYLIDLLDLLSAYGDCGAVESAWQCGDPLEYQGYDYETVQIGEQCWFAENLRAENYRNEEAIPTELSDSEWAGTAEGAVSVYDGDMSNLSTYGRLYNWYAVDDDRSLCPIGWHAATDSDWTSVVDLLGGDSSSGIALKSQQGWNNNGDGNDSVGFSALPGGVRAETGVYLNKGAGGYWWTSSPSNSTAYSRDMQFDENYCSRGDDYSLNAGFSIRCIKDTEQ